MRPRRTGPLLALLAVLLVLVPACRSEVGDKRAGDRRVEVFSWWAGPGEKEGFAAIVAKFKEQNSGVEFINAAVAGGAGTNAKSVLATRLQAGDPPDSYQVHAGLELHSDIKAGKVDDLGYLYEREGWRDKFPSGLVEALTVDGRIYSVPVNIHRSNLMWYNPAALARAGVAAPPRSWTEFLGQVDRLRARGITPLSIGPDWTHKHLLENVLLGELGADQYTGLWNGRTDWRSASVTAALTTFVKVLDASDLTSAAGDWQPALDKVVAGTAAYNVMGDWADAYLGRSRGLVFHTDYDVVPAPGTQGTFNFLSDSFTLPKNAPHRTAAEKWLVTCGSVAGQDAFNPQKGSIPARTDADPAKYTGYLASALADWRNPATVVVGSLTHGVVANNAWNSEIDLALAAFVRDRNAVRFVDMITSAYASSR